MLSIDGLSVHYGRRRAISDVCLQMSSGEVVGVLGVNGAGKTTLLKAIAGMLRPTSGSIRLGGNDVGTWGIGARTRAGVVLVPEGRQIWPRLTVDTHLRLGHFNRRRERQHLRDALERAYAWFPGLAGLHKSRVGLLSGGQQQMVAIARALMTDPKLLLLDEPSLGLAPAVVDELATVADELSRSGVTILLVEQNLRLATTICNRAYLIEMGSVVAEGATRELLENPRVVTGYLG